MSPKHYLQTIVSQLKELLSNILPINQSVPLHCWFFSAFWYQIIYFQPILANFRQSPPIFTYIAPIQTFCHNFFVYMSWVESGGVSFKISLLACILETPKIILKIFVGEWYILCQISTIHTYLFVLLPNLLEIFPHGQNLGFVQKSSVNFEFYL